MSLTHLKRCSPSLRGKQKYTEMPFLIKLAKKKKLSSTIYSVGKALGTQSISFIAVRMQVDKTFGEENVEIPSKTV